MAGRITAVTGNERTGAPSERFAVNQNPKQEMIYMDEKTVDISGLDKAEVLQALYNNSRPMGMGFLQAKAGPMSTEEARKELEAGDDSDRMFPSQRNPDRLYFDYLRGRPLKVDISGDSFRPWGYDRDNGGTGTAENIVARLRANKSAAA